MATKKAVALAFAAAAVLAVTPTLASAQVAAPTTASDVTIAGAADGTPAGAVQWFKNHNGSTGWEHYCEKAVENAYGTTGVWASANAHWNGASNKHPGDKNPPLGAFVYWATGSYGHVGISDGAGGIWATAVGNGAIGHVTKAGGGVDYFVNKWGAGYRGWTPGARPSQ